jgi:hypothetical protein
VKVVWLGFGVREMRAAVVTTVDGKPVITNQAMHPFIPLTDKTEAHYLAACLNSSPFEFGVVGHTQVGGKSFAQPNILKTLHIPRYDRANITHCQLAAFSQQAHEATADKDLAQVQQVEAEIDRLAAELWGLRRQELEDIQRSLEELR